jgi:hypothetical protein
MSVQDLRDSARERQHYLYHKRGWCRSERFPWRWSICVGRRIDGNWFNFGLTLGGEDSHEVQLSVGMLGARVWLTFEKLLPERWAVGWYTRDGVKNPRWFEDSQGREWGVYLHENHLVLSLGACHAGWSTDGSYGWKWSAFIDEKIFGRRDYAQTLPREFKNQEIWFPEGRYHLDITLSEDTWKYRRWPWWPLTRVVPRAHIGVVEKTGIPVPGKGENSWDCGDDATHGLTCKAASLHEAIEAVRNCVNHTRRRHGSGEAMYLKREQAGVKP